MSEKKYNNLKKSVVKMRRDNISVREINIRTGVPIRTVQRWTKYEQEADEARIRKETRELLMQGVSQAQIAKKHGVSQATVYNRTKKWGLRILVERNFTLAEEKKTKKRELASQLTNGMSVYQRAIRHDRLKKREDFNSSQARVKTEAERQRLERLLNKVYTDINYLTKLFKTGGPYHHELTVGEDELKMKIGGLLEASLRDHQYGEVGARYLKIMVDALSSLAGDESYFYIIQERIDKCNSSVDNIRAEIRRFDALVKNHLIDLHERRRKQSD